MSNGELKIEGASAAFELQVPLYEAQDVKDPANALLDRIHFSSGGFEAKVLTRSCAADRSLMICKATYLFNRDVDILHVECDLHKALVSNHVHMFHATMGGHSDQAFFDYSFQAADLRFRPPTFWESFLRDSGNGLWLACSAIASVLFLFSIFIAARSLRELAILGSMFIAGELAGALLGGGFQLSPQFLETASALTVAYLAIEVLLLPQAGQRWLVVAVLGAFHGFYFALFLGDRRGPGFLTGVVVGELLILAAIQLGFLGLLRLFPGIDRGWWTRAIAALLAAAGICWFVLRMIS